MSLVIMYLLAGLLCYLLWSKFFPHNSPYEYGLLFGLAWPVGVLMFLAACVVTFLEGVLPCSWWYEED